MSKLSDYLQEPLVLSLKPWKVVVVASLLVLFVLSVFQPFGIREIEGNKALILLGYMLVTAAGSSLVGYLFPVLFKRFYAASDWTVGRNYLNLFFVIVVISIGNTLYSLFVFQGKMMTPRAFFTVFAFNFIVTFLVGIIPNIVVAFLQHNQTLKANLQEAQELNIKLLAKKRDEEGAAYDSPPVTLSGSTKDSLELHPEQLLCLEAYGNYVKVNYVDKDKPKQKALRATIKQLEDQLTPFPFIVRCHRAFIVNTLHVLSVKGNSQGYRLVVKSLSEEIPVSRAYAKEVREQLG